MEKIKVGVFVGSLREGSFTMSVARYVMGLLPSWMEPELVDISKLPLYNQDYDEGTPPTEYAAFREIVSKQQAFIFATPEHNRSVPAALKNALDVGSRPYGHSVWAAKPGAIISVSPGAIGGFGANHHLRQTMTFLDVYMMQQPECYVGGVTNSLDSEGNVVNEQTQQFLESFVESYAEWVERFMKS